MLIYRLWACTRADKADSSTSDVEVCIDNVVTEGRYTPGWDYCLVPLSIEELCAINTDLEDWWQGDGCPSFSQYATYALNTLEPVLLAVVSVRRCSVDEISYDVIYYSPSVENDTYEFRWEIFSTSGELVSSQYASGYLREDTPYCCEGYPVERLFSGVLIDPDDCTTTTPYTIDDFPDSADTATDTATDTGTADTASTDTATTDTATTNTTDSADTGAQ